MVAETVAPTVAELSRSGELARMRLEYDNTLEFYRAVSGNRDARSTPGSFRQYLKESQAALREARFREAPEEACEFRPGEFRRFSNAQSVDETREWYLDKTDADERALDIEVTLVESDKYNCVLAGDIHLGPVECAYDKWLALLEWIGEQPDTGIIINGDLFNAATRNSVGMGTIVDQLPFEQQYELMKADLEPLAEAGKIHALLCGNHDQRIAKAVGLNINPVEQLAKELGVDYLGYEGFVRWRVNYGGQSQIYTGYHHHGSGAAGTVGGVMNSLKRREDRNRADYVVMGHVHQLLSTIATHRYVAPDGTIVTKKTPLIVSGSYQRLQGETYAAEKGYAPALIGSATVWLHGDKHSVHART